MFPLSSSQEIIWLQQQLVPESRAFYGTTVINFHGEIDPDLLRICVTDAAHRHDAMRLQLHDGESAIARQEVVKDVRIDIPIDDLRSVDNPGERYNDLLHHQMHDEFDLMRAPLVRWRTVRLSDDRWQLLMTEYHLIHDGRSTAEFISDFLRQYEAEVSDTKFVENPVPSYEEYVAYTTSDQYRDAAAASVRWWVKKLEGSDFGIDFQDLGTPRNEPFNFTGAQHRQKLPAELMDRMGRACRRNGYTMYSALLAIYAELCRRHSGTNDMVIGVPLANRPPGFERTVGMTVNTLPVPFSIDPMSSVREVAKQVMTTVFEATDHGDAPIQEIVRAVKRSGRGLDNPLFNVVFAMHDRPFPDVDVPGLAVDMEVALSTGSARFDIGVLVLPSYVLYGSRGDGGCDLVWDYSAQRFGADDVKLLAEQYESLAWQFVGSPGEPIGDLTITEDLSSADGERDERSMDIGHG